jgi:hypothetical protein
MALALCLGLAFTPLGCGSSQDVPVELPHQAREEPRAPEATVAQLTECARRGAAHLTDTHYAIVFDVDVTEDGSVSEARLRDSLLPDREMEACMASALGAMVVPRSVMAMRSWRRVSGGRVSPESRAYTGDAEVVGGAIIELIPILVFVAGVTIVVGVTAHAVGYVADEIAEAVRKRRRRITQVEKRCAELLVECLEHPQQPEWNKGTFGDRKACEACVASCKSNNGMWPHDKCPRPGAGPGDRWD